MNAKNEEKQWIEMKYSHFHFPFNFEEKLNIFILNNYSPSDLLRHSFTTFLLLHAVLQEKRKKQLEKWWKWNVNYAKNSWKNFSSWNSLEIVVFYMMWLVLSLCVCFIFVLNLILNNNNLIVQLNLLNGNYAFRFFRLCLLSFFISFVQNSKLCWEYEVKNKKKSLLYKKLYIFSRIQNKLYENNKTRNEM